MKIGYYCESPADRAALRIFTEGILGEVPKPIYEAPEARSVPSFSNALDVVIRGVHFNSDAEGLVMVVDCDDTEMHSTSHDADPRGAEDCRFCRIRNIVAHTRNRLRPRNMMPPLKVAIGLTVPAIEAWYLVGKNHQVGEAAWKVGLDAGRQPFSKQQLKQLVYGTGRPSLELATQCAVTEARRIIQNLSAIETAFPIGFGLMAQEIRSWAKRTP